MSSSSRTNESFRGQQTISSFFAKSSNKRKSSPIDLTADSDSDGHLPPPNKRQKGEEVKSSFFMHDSPSPERPATDPSCSIPTSRKRAGKEKSTFTIESTLNSSGRGKGKMKAVVPHQATVASSFRDKMRGRDMGRRNREDEDPSNSHAMDEDEMGSESSPGLSKIRKFAATAESGRMPRDKGANTKRSRQAMPALGPSGLPYTPLEETVMQFKEKYPGIVQLIEVGYKYCFFGDDAKIAGKVLGFFYGLDRNFLRTSCPAANLNVHIKKLVAAGHKVGVISQVETAALKKAGDNRNTLFDRKLTQLYTPSTFIDDLDAQDELGDFGQATPPLMTIVEEARGGAGTDDKVLFGIISVVPSTGDIVYDSFEDTLLRAELETRLAHIRPCELLMPRKLSGPTEKSLRYFAEHQLNGRARIERLKHKLSYTEAFAYNSDFYENQSGQIVATITDLPDNVVVALALAIQHLSTFGLSSTLLQTNFFTKFTTRTHMLLNTSTIKNLEIYRNQTDFTEKGTLFSVLNRTTTMFGKRLLKSWVGRPLVDKTILQQRVDAVEEARLGESTNLTLLRGLLKGLPDLARGLCSIQYGRCTPKELATLVVAFNRVGATFPNFSNPSEVGCTSTMWTDIVFALPALKEPMKDIFAAINLPRARDGNKVEMWTDPERFPEMEGARFAIMAVESELADQLKKIRKLLKIPALKYITSGGDEFLIEVPKTLAPTIPPKWTRMGSNAKNLRFYSPEIIRLVQEREQHKETLEAEADKAYKTFLQDMAQHYAVFRDVVNKLATADCLMSLATIGLDNSFCKPTFVEGRSLSIVEGRHPIIEQLKSDPFVPNSVSVGGDHPQNLVISGPNMGGKSSVVRMIALIVIMAQIGSYVPAQSVVMSIHDTILTRMGASDDLAAGRSTFMVEIAETCEIIKSASADSLVILDELGRGTSTFDGMAIASAVLQYLAREVKCKTLFITHYPTLARELETRYPEDIATAHMGFIEDTRIDGRREISFLYKLKGGISSGSFGIECARLAGVPESILSEAASYASTMQELMEKRIQKASAKTVLQLLKRCVTAERPDDAMLLELRTQMKMMRL